MSGLNASVESPVTGVVGVGEVGEAAVLMTESPVSVAGWAFTQPTMNGSANTVTSSVYRMVM